MTEYQRFSNFPAKMMHYMYSTYYIFVLGMSDVKKKLNQAESENELFFI